MISSKQNVRQLVALMKQYGIQNVVLCPGSRNAAIVQTILSEEYFNCYSVVDERSAAFTALGMADKTGRPAAVCCSSGTALMNMGSAICEAYYRAVPLLVISADRPKYSLNQFEGQTIPQDFIFDRVVNCSIDVDDSEDKEDICHINRQINQALLKLSNPSGPVHINIHLKNPIHDFTDETLSEVRKVNKVPIYPTAELYIPTLAAKECRKVMVLVGQMPYDKDISAAVRFLKEKGCLVLGEPIANLEHGIVDAPHFDLILKAVDRSEWGDLAPDFLITFGGNIVSKRIKTLLTKFPPKKHWHISHTFPVADPDPYYSVTDLFGCKVTDFVESLSLHIDTIEPEKSYVYLWSYLENALPDAEPVKDDSAFAYVRQILSSIPQKADVMIGNSTFVRLDFLFDQPKDAILYCNRGVSGIDGSLSTAMGIALKAEGPVYVLIGDLSFLYDVNALREGLPKNMVIFLLNNHGGGIFHEIPALEKVEKKSLEEFIASSHNVSPKGWAEDNGVEYHKADSAEEIKKLAKPSDRPKLVEIEVDIHEQAAELNSFMKNIKLNLNE